LTAEKKLKETAARDFKMFSKLNDSLQIQKAAILYPKKGVNNEINASADSSFDLGPTRKRR